MRNKRIVRIVINLKESEIRFSLCVKSNLAFLLYIKNVEIKCRSSPVQFKNFWIERRY